MTRVAGMGAAETIKTMVRRALKGALASKDRVSGAPYASLVQVATALDGRPVLLVSDLAVHTQNLLADPAASLLIDESDSSGDPATGARVSLSGRMLLEASPDGRARYLARHPGAAQFADFADFRFVTLDLASAHLIQGFGRIKTLPGREVLTDVPVDGDARHAWLTAHAKIKLEFMDVTGLDPDGVDIVSGDRGLRFGFGQRLDDPQRAVLSARELLNNYRTSAQAG